MKNALRVKVLAMLKTTCQTLCKRTPREHDCASCTTNKLIEEVGNG